MNHIFFVGIGGFIGAVLRFKLSGIILHKYPNIRLGISTLAVNFIGCFVLGVIAGIIEKHHILSQDTRLFIFTGVLGGFTTLSAFGYEVIFMLKESLIWSALSMIFLTVIGCLFLVWAGMKIGNL